MINRCIHLNPNAHTIAAAMGKRDLSKYGASVVRTICSLAHHGKPDPLVGEVSNSLRSENPGDANPQTFIVSMDALGRSLAMQRDLSTNVFSAGGAFVATDVSSPIAPMLRAVSRVAASGATIITGLTGNWALPLELTSATMSWVPETGTAATVSATAGTFGRFTLGLNRLSGAVSFSNQLAAQRADTEAFLSASLIAAWGAGFDIGALVGTGVSGQPCGLFNQAGTNTVTFGAAATAAKALSFEELIANNNGIGEQVRFIAHPGVKTKWAATARYAGGLPLWTDDDKIFGRDVRTTTALGTGQIVAADWEHVILGMWGGPDGAVRVTVNPFTDALKDQTQIVVSAYGDSGSYRPLTVAVSADSAVQ